MGVPRLHVWALGHETYIKVRVPGQRRLEHVPGPNERPVLLQQESTKI